MSKNHRTWKVLVQANFLSRAPWILLAAALDFYLDFGHATSPTLLRNQGFPAITITKHFGAYPFTHGYIGGVMVPWRTSSAREPRRYFLYFSSRRPT